MLPYNKIKYFDSSVPEISNCIIYFTLCHTMWKNIAVLNKRKKVPF